MSTGDESPSIREGGVAPSIPDPKIDWVELPSILGVDFPTGQNGLEVLNFGPQFSSIGERSPDAPSRSQWWICNSPVHRLSALIAKSVRLRHTSVVEVMP